MADEGEFPKVDGDTLFASEVNSFQDDKVATVIAGEGIDVSGATGDVTITGENSSASNKGIVIVAAGEGMDVSYASGTATISGENATISNKGIAKFNSSDFSVSSGDVALKAKTSYWSAVGAAFLPENNSDAFDRNSWGSINVNSTTIFLCPVSLPMDCIITGVEVSGSDSGENWYLYRRQPNVNTTGSIISQGNFNTPDTGLSIQVNNFNYAYYLYTSTLDSSDVIYGAVITYTTDYI